MTFHLYLFEAIYHIFFIYISGMFLEMYIKFVLYRSE